MNTLFDGRLGDYIRKALLLAIVLIAISYGVQSISSVQSITYDTPKGSIDISGHGEVLLVPDITTFTYSVVSDKATVADAQADATKTANAVSAYVQTAGVADKDIQTIDYSVNPQYEYQNAVCPASSALDVATYCPPSKQVLKGYEVRQTTKVKVRDTAKAGALLNGVGSKGATEVSGLSFGFDDPSAAQAQAREKAVADAKDKAQKLAQSLGVRLGSAQSFQENIGGQTPTPTYSPAPMGVAASRATAPDISVGQNTITDDVTVTYEIH